MLSLAETPLSLLQAISDDITKIRDPRARHWLILPGRGRAEYVLHQWARRTGIAAHSQEVQLRELLEQAAAGRAARFDFERLRLAVAAALPELTEHEAFPLPKSQSTTPITGAVLDWATSLAKALDEGLLCRQEPLRWEPDSFLHALASHPRVASALEAHVGNATPDKFDESAKAWLADWSRRGGLPHLWIQLDTGIPTLQFERFLQLVQILLPEHAERLHLFALSPSSEYWAEAVLRGRANPRIVPDPELHPGGLLWALGRCSQDLHRQLAETFLAVGEGGVQIPSPEPPDTLLGQLQLSARKSEPPAATDLNPVAPQDSSFTVHSTRSTLRELEVCRDRILQARQEIPDLRYEEILLLLADPKRQAPFVETALRGGEGDYKNLPFRMLGFGQAVPSPLAESLLLLLDKVRTRLGLDDLQTLVEDPLISARFGFQKAAEDGQDVVSWLREAQFKWGLDTQHRAEFQPIQEHRWNLFWALQRLGLGALIAPENRETILTLPHQPEGTVPIERASGLSLTGLAQLAQFAVALQTARAFWSTSATRSVEEWNKGLLELIGTFLDCSKGVSAQHLAQLETSLIPALGKAARLTEVTLCADAYIRLLGEKLAGIAESGGRGAGGICVADLRQYAGVPARLVLIAGLDDGAFPRRDDRPAWHPLSATRKSGDPSQRDADRHALLLAVLACKERLVLTYQGGSDDDAKVRPPSTALTDIFQALDQTAAPTPDGKPAHNAVLFEHPLNGFSPVAFHDDQPQSRRNLLGSDFRAAEVLHARRDLLIYPGLWQHPLPARPPKSPQTLAIDSLRTLLAEPARLFLESVGLRLPTQQSSIDGSDLLKPDGLQKWVLRDQILPAHLAHQDTAPLVQRLSAAGQIPRGKIGEALCEKTLAAMPVYPHPLKPNECVRRSFRVPLTDLNGVIWTLEGQPKSGWYLPEHTPKALFFSASSSSLKHKLNLCLDALLLAADPPPERAVPLRAAEAYFKNEKTLNLTLPSQEQAIALLQALLPLLQLAKRIPLPFWPGSADKVFEVAFKSPPPGPQQVTDALEAGFNHWSGNTTGPGDAFAPESELPASRYAFRGCDDPFLWEPEVGPLTWLPEAGQPIAWRIHSFIHSWMLESGLSN